MLITVNGLLWCPANSVCDRNVFACLSFLSLSGLAWLCDVHFPPDDLWFNSNRMPSLSWVDCGRYRLLGWTLEGRLHLAPGLAAGCKEQHDALSHFDYCQPSSSVLSVLFHLTCLHPARTELLQSSGCGSKTVVSTPRVVRQLLNQRCLVFHFGQIDITSLTTFDGSHPRLNPVTTDQYQLLSKRWHNCVQLERFSREIRSAPLV